MISRFTGLLFFICLQLAAPKFSSAQCPDPGALNLTTTFFNQENGLASNVLEGIAQDSTGYRYFLGVDGKWSRYDGVNFTVRREYDRIDFTRYAFVDGSSEQWERRYHKGLVTKREKNPDPTGYEWALEGDSLFWINAPAGKSRSYLIPKDLPRTNDRNFYPAGNGCYVSSIDRVYLFDAGSGKFTQADLPTLPFPLVKDPSMFIMFRAQGVYFIQAHNFLLKGNQRGTEFKLLCKVWQDPNHLPISDLVMNRYYYISDGKARFCEIDLVSGAMITHELSDLTGIRNSSALEISCLRNFRGFILIGTSNEGMFIFNRCTRSMQQVRYLHTDAAGNIPLTSSVTWIAVDDEEVVWVQTEGGLLKLEVNGGKLKPYLPASIFPERLCNDCNNVRAIYPSGNEHLLIGTFGGMYLFNRHTGNFSFLASPDGKSPWNDMSTGSITGDTMGNIFIGSWSNTGVYMMDGEGKRVTNLLPGSMSKPYEYMRCMYYSPDHVLWMGTTKGVFRIANPLQAFDQRHSGDIRIEAGSPSSSARMRQTGECFTITGDAEGNVWMGCIDGLYLYQPKKDSLFRYVHSEEDPGSLSDNEVRSIRITAENDIWIGTNKGGLNHFDQASNTFTSYTMENGLPNNSIYTILEDKNGFLWLGTNAGLCRFSKSDHSVRTYTPRDGFQNYEFNTNAAAVTPDGKFCFGGRTGFNVFHPDTLSASFEPPQVTITRFKIFDKEYPVPDRVIHLPYTQNSFSFDFAALSYYRTGDNQYAYKLEGADKDWIKSGNRQYTSYANLTPGTYTFLVKAANYTGAWNPTPTKLRIVIAPAWFNSWLFRIAIALFLATGIYLLYRYRLSQVTKLHAIRNRIASDLHDEIGSTLSSISLSSTVIQNKLNGTNTEITKLLQQVSRNTDNMMEALSDIVWAINTRNDRFDNVVNRMRAFAVEMLEPSGIAIHFSVSEDTASLHLDMQQRKNLYLIFKEAIHNIVKYAECKNVSVKIGREGGRTLFMEIQDDGNGFETALAGEETSLSGNGIRNMKKRAEELAGTLILESGPGKGTRLFLRVSI